MTNVQNFKNRCLTLSTMKNLVKRNSLEKIEGKSIRIKKKQSVPLIKFNQSLKLKSNIELRQNYLTSFYVLQNKGKIIKYYLLRVNALNLGKLINSGYRPLYIMIGRFAEFGP